MKYRKFGRTGWQVSEIGYGMWGLAGWTGSDDSQTFEALGKAVELGCNFFDTAWAYGNGKSEKMLGELVRSFPDKRIYTATKIPPRNFKWPARAEYSLDDCFPPDHIEEYVKKSLENTGLGSLDLVQLHTWQDKWLSDERGLAKLVQLKNSGLFHAIGISLNRWEPWNGIEAVKSGLVDSVQVIYNIFDQNPKDELFPACMEMDVAVIARVPFDEGTLTGTLTRDSKWPEGDWRNTYFVKANLDASVDRAEALKQILPCGMSLPEMALRFILDEKTVSTVIPGMRSIKHVTANLKASDYVRLSSALMKDLEKHRWDRKPTSWSQ